MLNALGHSHRLLLMILLVVPAHLWGEGSRLQPCTPQTLDVNLVAPEPADAQMKGHWLALEFRNRGEYGCVLMETAIRFPAEGLTLANVLSEYSDKSPSALAFQAGLRVLEAGQTAHILLAWSTAQVVVNDLAIDRCAIHDSMILGPDVLGRP